MSEKLKQQIENNSGQEMSQLVAAIDLGRRRIIYLGFDVYNKPMLTTTINELSEQVKESLTMVEPGKVQTDRVLGEIIPVKFLGFGRILDKKNPNTEDVLSIGVMDVDGNVKTISVGELDILDSVEHHTVAWEGVNPDTIFASSDRLPTSMFYSVFLPSKESTNASYAVLFDIPMGETNESIYSGFILKMISVLIENDKHQNDNSKRGYSEELEKVTGSDEGGAAYKLMSLLIDMGGKTNEDTENWLAALKRGTDELSLGDQLHILAGEFGLPGFKKLPENSFNSDIKNLNVNELINRIVRRLHKRAVDFLG